MIITNQRRMAAAILSQKEGRPVGIHRIWIDPDYLDEVISAVQKDDVRRLISDGIIKACLLYTSPSPRDLSTSRMPSSA